MKKKLMIILLVLAIVIIAALAAYLIYERSRPPEKTQPAAEEPEPMPAPEPPEENPEPVPEPEPEPEPESEPEPEPEPEPSARELAVTQLMSDLSAALTDELSGLEGRWAVYAEDIETGAIARAELNASCDGQLVSASIVKIFIMAAVYDAVANGELDEDEALSDNLRRMVAYSDNHATNDLVALLGGGDPAAGMARVNEYCESIGCPNVRMNRLMLVEDGTQNYVSETDCARLLRMIFEGECVSPDCSEKMLSFLKDQFWEDYLNKGVPADTVIAHKTGDLIGICQGDVGIVYGEQGPYIVCVMCNDAPDYNGNVPVLGRLSGIVYDYMSLRPAQAPPPEDEMPEAPEEAPAEDALPEDEPEE